jgi:CRP/FNR family transcriptional activator FtrB
MNQGTDDIHLAGVPLFAPMVPASRLALQQAGAMQGLARGTVLGGTERDSLLVLLSGAVALGVHEADRVAVLSTFQAPCVLNLACVMVQADCEIRWRALQAVTLLSLPGPAFRAALAADLGLAARAISELAQAHQRLLSGAASQRLRSSERRVAAYLLSLTDITTGGATVRLPYDKNLLAALLGMTPENFSRAIGRLLDLGVSVRGSEVSIDRVERLQADLAG